MQICQRGRCSPHSTECMQSAGSLLNKVAGNFTVTAGKVLPIMELMHMTGFMENWRLFSHRIEKLIWRQSCRHYKPLEGDEKTTDINLMNFQIFCWDSPLQKWQVDWHEEDLQYSERPWDQAADHSTGSMDTWHLLSSMTTLLWRWKLQKIGKHSSSLCAATVPVLEA